MFIESQQRIMNTSKKVKIFLKHSSLSLVAILVMTIVVIALPMTNDEIVNAQDSRVVTIYYDGLTKSFATNADTVGQALERAGVSLSQYDLSEPSLDSPISADSFNINIYRARPVVVIDGDQRVKVMSPYQAPRLIAEQAGFNVYPEDQFAMSRIDDFILEGSVGLKLVIIRAKSMTLNLYGTSSKIRTHASTVAELLNQKGINPEPSDTVRPAMDSIIDNGSTIYLIRVGNDRIVVDEAIAFSRRIIQDTSQPVGYEKIQTAGKPGSQLVTYQVTLENDVEVNRKVVSKVIVDQPVEEVVVIGADYRGTYPNNAAIISALRQCETHGNYQTNTGNGFYGAYQFMTGTWDRTAIRMGQSEWVGVLPSNAPAGVQDAFVLSNARASGGGFWSQHPGCSKKLNLPQFPY